MNKSVWALLAVFCLIVIVFFSGVAKAIVLFLLLGVVPGTDLVLPPIAMMVILTAVGWILIMHATGRLSETIAFSRQVKKQFVRKSRFPLRRYHLNKPSQSVE